MNHWLRLSDHQPSTLRELVEAASALKSAGVGESKDPLCCSSPGDVAKSKEDLCTPLRGKVMGMVFFNPSLRTRVSFESLMFRYGGHAICLNVGEDAWRLEHRDGEVMDSDCAEHVREAAPVLCRYCDVLGVRTFAGLKSASEDAADAVINAFARYATVPVVSMESAVAHPCQGLADWLTIKEKLGDPAGRRFVLSWAPHVRALPMAVANSAVLAAAGAGMNVTIVHPPGYDLSADVLDQARRWCQASGAELTVTNEQTDACRAADVVYVKSWGSAQLYGQSDAQRDSFQQHKDWTVGVSDMGWGQQRSSLLSATSPGRSPILMHCLPVRRNVVITDAALDDPRCVVVDQAENRMWVQTAILSWLLGEPI